MNRLENLLKELNFTQYEAQTLTTLIRFNVLTASQIHKYSGVPQPKIYENMNKLQEKGLVEIIPKGRKNIFRIKPREVIQEYLINYTRKIQKMGQNGIEIIDKLYNTEETEDIPFVGIAGQDRIREYLSILIDTAKTSFISFFPVLYYDENIINLIKEKSTSIEFKLIFHDKNIIESLKAQLPNIEIYFLESNIFESINNVLEKIELIITPENRNSFGFDIFKKIAYNLKEIFGLTVVDRKKSLFKLPIPIDTPMAIMSTLSDIVQFHCQGIDEILASSKKIQ